MALQQELEMLRNFFKAFPDLQPYLTQTTTAAAAGLTAAAAVQAVTNPQAAHQPPPPTNFPPTTFPQGPGGPPDPQIGPSSYPTPPTTSFDNFTPYPGFMPLQQSFGNNSNGNNQNQGGGGSGGNNSGNNGGGGEWKLSQ